MFPRVRQLSLLVPVALILALSACSSGSKNNNAGSNINSSSSKSNTSSGQPAASGKKLSDCEYASRFVTALSSFKGAPVPSGSSQADASSAVSAVVTGANKALSDLTSITPPDDFKQFHSGWVKAFQDVVNQMQDAQKSVNSGDPTKALTTLNNAHSSFVDQADKLQKQSPALIQRLDACPVPTP